MMASTGPWLVGHRPGPEGPRGPDASRDPRTDAIAPPTIPPLSNPRNNQRVCDGMRVRSSFWRSGGATGPHPRRPLLADTRPMIRCTTDYPPLSKPRTSQRVRAGTGSVASFSEAAGRRAPIRAGPMPAKTHAPTPLHHRIAVGNPEPGKDPVPADTLRRIRCTSKYPEGCTHSERPAPADTAQPDLRHRHTGNPLYRHMRRNDRMPRNGQSPSPQAASLL
jgi:hypothetical protein